MLGPASLGGPRPGFTLCRDGTLVERWSKALKRFKQNKEVIDTAEKRYLKAFSPMLTLNSEYNELGLRHFSAGKLLDAGAGSLRNKATAIRYCDRYESLDINESFEGLDHVGDIQDMSDIPTGHFDTVLMTHVLEHLPRPADALKESRRVLTNEGVLIGSTPHLSRLHGLPHDYYRFTNFGLIYLLRDEAGFNEWAVFPVGGILAFLGHQFSTLLVCGTLHLPLVGHLIARFNHGVIVPATMAFDKILGIRSWLPFMYMFMATSGSFTADQLAFLRQMPGCILSADGQPTLVSPGLQTGQE